MDRPVAALARPPAAVALSVLLIASLTAISPANAEESSGTAADPAFGQVPTETQITLVTGDVVHLGQASDGSSVATVDPAPRTGGAVPQFRITSVEGQTRVVPSDVETLIGDQLDPQLFNVTALVEQGFDDAHSDTVPVILDYPDGTARTLASPSIDGTTDEVALASVSATAVEVEKSDTRGMTDALSRLAAAEAGADHPMVATDPGPLAGVEKIWLDARMEAYLDESTGQIGAPAAWDSGLDGSGVTVAVLDTGIDESHPDLSGNVVAAENFSWADSTDDNFGHGTHVASIVGGSGAASDGQYQGVAPSVELLNGKVLDDTGSGDMSGLIAGMEWAAAQNADIVNMSLGFQPGSSVGPIINEAIDRLSADGDVLFVAAAGNNYCSACIGSPGDAAAALTVGAVDDDDQLADFSSRGPSFGTMNLKPDVTAPGVTIDAARADGTGHTDGPYIPYSGTSMAAPHVAGAAALLSQANPELSNAELKAALMATAVPNEELGVYDQGTGRVDLERALTSSLLPSAGSLDFGAYPFPQSEQQPDSRQITYSNSTDEPITISLTASASETEGTATDVLSVEPAELTVPAGGTATATVHLNVPAGVSGDYVGQVHAEYGDGGVIDTPVGFVFDFEMVQLQVDMIARDGRTTYIWPTVISTRTGAEMYDTCGKGCFNVPVGTYSVSTPIKTFPAWADAEASWPIVPLNTTMAVEPELTLDADATLVMDARDGVEITVDTPDHDARANIGGATAVIVSRTSTSGVAGFDQVFNGSGSQMEERLFVTPTEEVTVGDFSVSTRWRLEEPSMRFTADGIELDPYYYRADFFSDNSWQFPTLEGTEELPVVAAGAGSAEDVAAADLDGALALIERSDDISVADQSNLAAEAGAELVAIYSDQPGPNNLVGSFSTPLEVPTVRVTREEGLALLDAIATGPVTVTATGTKASPYLYDLMYTEYGRVGADQHYTADTDELVAVERQFNNQPDTEMTYTEISYALQPQVSESWANTYPVEATPRTRTDYHVPDASIGWAYEVHSPQREYNHIWPQEDDARLEMRSDVIHYDQAGEHRQEWFQQPLTAVIDPHQPATRSGDILTINGAGFADSSGNYQELSTDSFDTGIDTYFEVWHGDEIIGETDDVPAGTIAVPPSEESYRIDYEAANNGTWVDLATQVNTEWTFTSEHVDEDSVEPLPLMSLDFDFDLTGENRMYPLFHGPNLLNTLKVDVEYPDGVDGRARWMDFSVSYDDGDHWRRVLALPRGNGQYTVMLPLWAPRNNTGYISFQVSAGDRDGNRIDQEIIRAAALPD